MKNSFWLGLLLGSLFPAIAFLADRHAGWTSAFAPGKEALPYMAAAGANLLLARLCYKRRTAPLDGTAKGLLFATFVAMLAYLRTMHIVA